jgi:phage minor structural protein
MIRSFLPSATTFTSNGEKIIQAIKCIEHRESGEWYIDLTAPEEYKDYLANDYILVVETKEKSYQPFRIKNPKITGKVEVRAHHIGFDSLNYAVELSTIVNGNAQACLNALNGNIDGTHPFTFTSTIATLKTFSVVDSSLYNALVQIAEEYNGYLDFDEWDVTITSSIGADRGVVLLTAKTFNRAKSTKIGI